MNSEDLKERLHNLEEAKHETIYQLGMSDGKIEAVRQILTDMIAEEQKQQDDEADDVE